MSSEDWWKDKNKITKLIHSLIDPIDADLRKVISAFPNEISEDFFQSPESSDSRVKSLDSGSQAPIKVLLALQQKLNRITQLAEIGRLQSEENADQLPPTFQRVEGGIFERMKAFSDWLETHHHVFGWLISKSNDHDLLGSSDLDSTQKSLARLQNRHLFKGNSDGVVPLDAWLQCTIPQDSLEAMTGLSFLFHHQETLAITLFLNLQHTQCERLIFEVTQVLEYVLQEDSEQA